MKKLLLSLLLTIVNLSFASNHSDHQPKPVFRFPIKLELKNNPTNIGFSTTSDKQDKFACDILKISWQEEDKSKLWRAYEMLYEKKGNTQAYSASCMTINDFVNNTTNPYLVPGLAGSFSFPRSLPDNFVKEMIKNGGTTTRETDKAILHFALQNKPEELKDLGLSNPKQSKDVETSLQSATPAKQPSNNSLYAIMPLGLLSILAFWWFTKSI